MPARSETECVARVANWELLGVSHIATTIVATSESRGLVGLAGVRTVSTTLEWGLTNAPQVALKGVLESRIGGGLLGAAAQGLTDFLFHPELTSQQRAGTTMCARALTSRCRRRVIEWRR